MLLLNSFAKYLFHVLCPDLKILFHVKHNISVDLADGALGLHNSEEMIRHYSAYITSLTLIQKDLKL